MRHINDYNESYRTNSEAWSIDRKNIRDIAAFPGSRPEDVIAALKLYRFPTLGQQTGDTWLGGGAAVALRTTSMFLKKEKKSGVFYRITLLQLIKVTQSMLENKNATVDGTTIIP